MEAPQEVRVAAVAVVDAVVQVVAHGDDPEDLDAGEGGGLGQAVEHGLVGLVAGAEEELSADAAPGGEVDAAGEHGARTTHLTPPSSKKGDLLRPRARKRREKETFTAPSSLVR